MSLLPSWCQELRAARLARDWSEDDLADQIQNWEYRHGAGRHLGVSRSYVSEWETGVDHLTAQPEQDPRTIERAKQQVRDRIWARLEREAAAKPPGRVVGKIPNFLGAEAAADQLAALPAWETAHVLKANPDKAQRPVRARALTEGKVLYMAVPRLADELPFYLVDPQHLSMSPWEAAAKEGAAKAGRKVAATELPSVDLVVCGSVAVNRQGARASARAEDSPTSKSRSWSRPA